MRFRIGFVLGAGIGYVLGARAGRERYETIKRVASEARRHPAVAQIVDQVTGVTDAARDLVAGGLDSGAQQLRAVAEPTDRKLS
jgi:hypothetical protein